MNTLIQFIKEAESKHIAIGHFNFAELTVMKAAMAAARELNVPVILGSSESEREFLGIDLLKSIIDLRFKIKDLSIFFNADHTKSLEKVKEAIGMGFDSITFDNSHLPLEENILRTKEVVDFVRTYETQSSSKPHILVEGEIGFIGSGSQLRENVPENIQQTTPEEAVRFVQETGVDMLAPAVGNVHGIISRTNADGTRTNVEPSLNIELIKNIKEALRSANCDVPLVLHGASGNSDEDIRAAIKAGISIIHISTEVRLAWRNVLTEFLQKNLDEVAPYKILATAEKAAQEVIKNKLKLFNSL